MTVHQIIEKNIATIVGGGIIGLMSFVAGQTQTNGTIHDLTKRVEVLEQRVAASAIYHNCATRHLDALERGDKGATPCDLEGM